MRERGSRRGRTGASIRQGWRIAAARSIAGFAALGDTLYMGTIDARLIALRVKDGSVIWEAPVADGSKGYSVTMAPLVVKDKVIVGVSGSEFPTRGFIDAYNAKTGNREWRFYTVPSPGEPGSDTWPSAEAMAKGGGGVWVAGSYDPELNLVFYGTGNPNPAYYGQDRQGDNLYTSSIVALDADTGKLRWHYQFTRTICTTGMRPRFQCLPP